MTGSRDIGLQSLKLEASAFLYKKFNFGYFKTLEGEIPVVKIGLMISVRKGKTIYFIYLTYLFVYY